MREIRERPEWKKLPIIARHREGDDGRPGAAAWRPAPTTTSRSRSTSTSCSRCVRVLDAAAMIADASRVQRTFDIELQAAARGDLRPSTTTTSASTRVVAAAPARRRRSSGSASTRCPQLQGKRAARSVLFRRLLRLPDRAASREMFRDPVLLPGAPRATVGADPAHLSVAQASGSRAAAPARRSTRSRSCSTRRACSTARSSTRPTSIRTRSQEAATAIYALDRLPQLHARTIGRRRRAPRSSRLLHGRLRRAPCSTRRSRGNVVFADHSLATDERLRRDAARLVPERASSTSTARCRTAPSASSRARSARAGSSGSARGDAALLGARRRVRAVRAAGADLSSRPEG